MTPSEYIAKYAEYRDIHSLENVLGAYRHDEQEWVLAEAVLSSSCYITDKKLMDFVCDFLAEIQFAESTLIDWYNEL